MNYYAVRRTTQCNITVCLMPLVPGFRLYYAILGALSYDYGMFLDQFRELILICFSICIGFILVDIVWSHRDGMGKM